MTEVQLLTREMVAKRLGKSLRTLDKMLAGEREKLLKMEEVIGGRVVGTVKAGPVGVLGRGGTDGAGGRPPPSTNADLAISPMPASEPSTPIVSIGSMITFWLGACASSVNALRYCWATK